MKNSQKTLWMHMKLYFTVFLPKQRNASQHTITACQDTWNLFLRYLSDKKGMRLEALGFGDIDSDTVVSFLDAMENERGWKPSTRNQRLSCIRSFLHYAACMEPTLYAYASELDGIPLKKDVNKSHVMEFISQDGSGSYLQLQISEKTRIARSVFHGIDVRYSCTGL